MKVEFVPSVEKRYYSPANFNKNLEKSYLESNKFNLAFYVHDGLVYAYFMGKYYIGTILDKNLDELDIILEIKAQCNDPYKVNEKEIIEID